MEKMTNRAGKFPVWDEKVAYAIEAVMGVVLVALLPVILPTIPIAVYWGLLGVVLVVSLLANLFSWGREHVFKVLLWLLSSYIPAVSFGVASLYRNIPFLLTIAIVLFVCQAAFVFIYTLLLFLKKRFYGVPSFAPLFLTIDSIAVGLLFVCYLSMAIN